jgi:hypothetical protein
MPLFAHHTKSYLGIEMEINGHSYPDGAFDHAVFLGALLLMAYGVFAIVRDLVRWRRRQKVT